MAAVIEFRTGSAISEQPTIPHRPDRPALSVIHGGRSPEVLRIRRAYLRRRLIALALVVAAVVLLGNAVGAIVAPAATSSERIVTHTVRPGDTLWSLAVSADPQADPRDVVDRIVELNSAGGASFSPDAPLRVGKVLTVPAVAG